MIVDSPLQLQTPDLFLRLRDFADDHTAYLKVEGLNLAGSIKLKPAIHMITDLESSGAIRPGSAVIESSSGNLGVALAVVCGAKGYSFTCITDPNAPEESLALMRAYGADVVVITQRDEQGGFLGSRIAHIKARLREDPKTIWPNQYANHVNARAHCRTTAREIHEQFSDLDYLFVGAGTTGTLTGCAAYFAVNRPQVRVIAVDAVGSVTFGGRPSRRHIPGLGTSVRPAIASTDNVADIVHVAERDTVQMCRSMLDRYGLLVGGSTGTVLAGLRQYAPRLPEDAVVVAISPDLGDRYVRTVYDPTWLAERGLDLALVTTS